MNLTVVLLIFAFIYEKIFCAFDMRISSTKQASFDRFDGTCPGHNVPITVHYHGLRTVGTKLFLNTTIVSKEDIDTDPHFILRFERCKSRENLDTCEEFYVFKTDSYCSLINDDNKIWSPFFGVYTPKWKCPIKKGKYHGINNTLDMSAFLLFPIESWVWRVSGDMTEKGTNRLLECIFVEARVLSKH